MELKHHRPEGPPTPNLKGLIQALTDLLLEAAAAARDAELEPVLKELSHLSARAAAEGIERRGLGSLSYKTIARARVRLGLED